jgi:hypothetical protein
MMGGQCNRRGEPGSGSPLYYINTALGLPGCCPLKNKQNFKTNGPLSFALQHVMLNVSQLDAHIQPLVNSGSHLIHTDTCKYMHLQHARQIMSLDA